MAAFRRLSLDTLPVELLHEIQLYAVSPSLPYTCKHIFDVFKLAPSSYRAQFLLSATQTVCPTIRVTKLLRYPLCTKEVLAVVIRMRDDIFSWDYPSELPRRLFRPLHPKPSSEEPSSKQIGWSDRDKPLPFLNYLYSLKFRPPNANSHEGYALTKAVHAAFIPLIQFLLDHGASPRCKDGLAVLVAIRRRDLSLVKMLIQKDDVPTIKSGKSKKPKLEDRITATQDMLKAAVKCNARDIVEYLTKEKGCVPDMQTILLMR
ncbi:hypothetical protein SERLA73DRAFT_122824 [Serpula lacrymans var. lacrymans S7.3]|uniref:Uncharacterized protein n=2 Tax=Serpula lacrymans var. lacrymans TaxID=341189 RepID=F8PYK5_SERL3|nr:uncharacterized protein SERLADRAFT_369809 [Serpula lacrymans var. lacrymans S7.9]EGN98968.1 hypothetical protein SERLA73DRAFT_122824 [Serpula lacrymans var. lacrymans S7.3]EGO24556.1 hypothetical protein SERLADRAFT_369809 [Serpula lacrymans var. lacrymans S7.9]